MPAHFYLVILLALITFIFIPSSLFILFDSILKLENKKRVNVRFIACFIAALSCVAIVNFIGDYTVSAYNIPTNNLIIFLVTIAVGLIYVIRYFIKKSNQS